jgi:hypothetical protein
MTNHQDPVFRLTALWAFSECALGGIMHALKLPFTGLFVGGFAVLCIGLLAHMTQRNVKALLQATLMVLLVKAIVSPHSPPTAYLAVGFQGVAGALLLRYVRPETLAAMLFGAIAMLESALQKLLVLLLFFGKPLIEAFDLFTAEALKTLGGSAAISGSSAAAGIYMGIYGIWGLLLGYWILRLPKQLEQRRARYAGISWPEDVAEPTAESRKKRRWVFPLVVLVFITLVFLYTGGKTTGIQKALYAVLRSTAVLAAWFFLLQPLVTWFFQRWAQRKTDREKGQLEQIIDYLPEFRNRTPALYRHISTQERGWKRWREFVLALFVTALYPQP